MKTFSFQFICFFLIIGAGLSLSPIALSQMLDSNRQSYDKTTQDSLRQLQRYLYDGTARQKIDELLYQIINGSGYIPPLAEIFYKLAQTENEGPKVVQCYQTIIGEWPSSAWAQKSVVELVPLILMSSGELGASLENMIWEKVASLSKPADDAASFGEDPNLLHTDVMLSLIYLAHYRKDYDRVQSLTNEIKTAQNPYQDQIDLALAHAFLQMNQKQMAYDLIQQWLGKYPDSNRRAFAYFIQFMSAQTEDQQRDVRTQLMEGFANTLEVVQLNNQMGQMQ